jgi:FtsH-binding integral membrane protein
MNPNNYYSNSLYAADATGEVRAGFIRRTYGHLAGAILAFVLLEVFLFQTALPQLMMDVLATSRFSWLIVLGAFMGVSYLANNWATSQTSINMQYIGLAVYVVAEAIIFVPLLYLAAVVAGPDTILSAGFVTLLLFTGLTFVVLTTRKDFSFLGSILKVSCFVALGIIVASMLFGFTLGLIFSAAMVIVASAAILYNTSNILHHYNPNQHVAAALSLFASVALLFWYVLRIFMGMSRRD